MAPFWHWSLVPGLVTLIVCAVVVTVQLARREVPETTGGPVGIGGWLILVALMQIRGVFDAFDFVASNFGGTLLANLTLGGAFAWLALVGVTTIAMFRKHRSFRKLWKWQAATYITISVLAGASFVWMPSDNEAIYRELSMPIGVSILLVFWWWYMSVSQRVKNTFGGATLTISNATRRQERFLKAFAAGFLATGLSTAYTFAHDGIGEGARFALCTLIGLLVGGGVAVWYRQR